MDDKHPDIDALLVKRATSGLTDEERATLSRLLDAAGHNDSDELDLAAAAIAAATAVAQAETTSMPAELKAKILNDAPDYVGSAAEDEAHDELAERRKPRQRRQVDWGWAAAAALAVAFIGTQLIDAPSPDPVDAREALLAADDTLRLAWGASDAPGFAEVEGDVVWSDRRQEGYLTLANIPANDPAVAQYQLWVVDPDRDDEPVDGGVFDVPAGADRVVIPINAKLRVNDPVAFAITRERPGGVVVSNEPLLLVASAG